MRASQVREAIAKAIKEATSEGRASAGDGYVWLRQAQEPDSVASRAFMVRLLSGPTKSELNTCDLFDVTYQVAIFYPAAKDIEDRVSGDLEQLYRPLWNLHQDYADLEETTPSAPVIDEANGLIVTRIDMRCLYRLDSTIIEG
jgi:hypothetical protein